MAYPACCVVRASIALPPGRSRFWATCGVTFRLRHSATKSAVSYALSPPTVTCLVPGICSSITSAASRSAVPLASNTSVFTISPCAVLHQQIPVVTQLGFLALAFACQLGIRVRLRCVRLVGPLLPVEIYRRIAKIVRRNGVLRILSLKTFQTRPRFQQRPVHGEVLVREQTLLACLLQYGLEEGFGNIPIEQALAVLGENGHIPDGVVHVQAHEPTEQQVIVKLFHTAVRCAPSTAC